MATLRQYFETDSPNTAKMHAKHTYCGEDFDLILHFDFNAETAFVSCYIPGSTRTIDFFTGFVLSLEYGKTQFKFGQRITLPAAKTFAGIMYIENKQEMEILAQFFGDPDWISTRTIQASKRIFLYSETDLEITDIRLLKETGKKRGHSVQFRSQQHLRQRTEHERPLAFISHDSRDKEPVARRIAINLQQMMCPVWYDEFSLKVGDKLRQSIEKGLKECRKCILVLSPNFISNQGWTRAEFDAIFTRELLEQTSLILPVWYNITKEALYEYSPGLLNIKGIDWVSLGEEKACRQLHQVIVS